MGEPRRTHFQMLRSFAWADLFTFGNACCGTVSLFLCLYYLAEGQRRFLWAIFLLLPLALAFDGFDGYVARRWGQRSSLGADLDSLADIISFGVAPAVLGFSLGLRGLWDVIILTYCVGCGIGRPARYNVTHTVLADATGKVKYPVGWLERMAQFKTKAKQAVSVSTGLFDYPVLQAADVLLYKTDLVPVGEDQRQHIEFTRDVATRFNAMFGEIFVVPDIMTRQRGARIAALDDPRSKMSKSLGEQKSGHSIGLLDDPDTVRRTIMSAVTDSGQETRFQYASPGVLNLLTVYECLTHEGRSSIEAKFAGKGYNFLKNEVIEVVLATIRPVQARYEEIVREPSYIEMILRKGADRIRPLAAQTIEAVRRATGLG